VKFLNKVDQMFSVSHVPNMTQKFQTSTKKQAKKPHQNTDMYIQMYHMQDIHVIFFIFFLLAIF